MGKRLSKHLKACIGPWLSSLYDFDRQVSRAAVESFEAVFDTEKKRDIVWEKYGGDVLKYVSDVIINETAKTISCTHHNRRLILGDERFLSAEDMESRFALVVAMCLSVLARLIGNVFLVSLNTRNPTKARAGHITVNLRSIPYSKRSKENLRYRRPLCTTIVFQDACFIRKEYTRYCLALSD